MTDKNNKLETYVVSVSYYDPSYTTIVIPAKDEDEAEEKVMKITSKMKNVEVKDISRMKDAKALQEFYDNQTAHAAAEGSIQ